MTRTSSGRRDAAVKLNEMKDGERKSDGREEPEKAVARERRKSEE